MKIPFFLALASLAIADESRCCRPFNSFEQGHELRRSQLMAGYNAPARIDVRGCWDLYLTGSYIYWIPSEDNLEVGVSSTLATTLPIQGNFVNMQYKFKSGYKAGLGIFSSWDNWDAYAEYTSLAGSDTSRTNGPLGGAIIPLWGIPLNFPDDPTLITSARSRWKFELATLDVVLGRSCYVGTKLTFRPFFGFRGAEINQKYVATYYESFLEVPYQVRDHIHSRGCGPEAGIETSWLLGYGLRLIGQAETDLLFTSYRVKSKEVLDPGYPATIEFAYTINNVNLSKTVTVTTGDDPYTLFQVKQSNLYTLRPHLNLEVGVGWGSYWCNHDFHIDLAATYNFQVFWDQNMFRNYLLENPMGNLYINGGTGTLRIDF